MSTETTNRNENPSMADFEQELEASFKKIENGDIGCLEKQDTETLLALVFDRLYTIRNQLVHGGATCGSVKNRIQIDDGAEFLMEIIPQMLIIMMICDVVSPSFCASPVATKSRVEFNAKDKISFLCPVKNCCVFSFKS